MHAPSRTNTTDIGSPKVQLWLAILGIFFLLFIALLYSNSGRTVLHDPKNYPEPLEFNPDRFIKDGRLDPSVKDPIAAFGFGRR